MSARCERGSASGFTLLEVVLALAIVALALLGWTVLQGRAARAEHGSRIRGDAAAWMRDELRIQRNVRAFDCRARPSPRPGWTCSVERTCLDTETPCQTESVRVDIAPPEGPGLHGATAVWWPLQRAPVGAPP